MKNTLGILLLITSACGGVGADNVVSAAGPGNAACANPDDDCCRACAVVVGCREDVSTAECADRCVASNFVVTNWSHCFSLRVLWTDEEGCEETSDVWDAFDDADTCG